MSNLAGKAYAMNLFTPLKRALTPINRLAFWAVGTPLLAFSLRGLQTLSMIHYARWVIIDGSSFPRLRSDQPREHLHYDYMLFFSNFNGSWSQYVDSFSSAIPSGLNLLWYLNVGWPKSTPQDPFHRYVTHNQLWTNHYYSAYPMAASNDVKSGSRVRKALLKLAKGLRNGSPERFVRQYREMLKSLQTDLSLMDVTPPVSPTAEVIEARRQSEGTPQSDFAGPN